MGFPEILIIVIILGAYAVSIFAVADCIKNEAIDKNQKVTYCVLIVLTGIFGAAYYLFKHKFSKH